jgi:hypothetical protein
MPGNAPVAPNHAEDDGFEPWPERLELLEHVAREAARLLDREIDPDAGHALGYQGGSIGYLTTAGEWLSVRLTPLKGDQYEVVRERIRLADRLVPRSVPRPHEIASVIFDHEGDSVFASVNPLAPGRSASRYPCVMEDDEQITDVYVAELRGHIDTLARVRQAPPHSQTLHERFTTWVREECHIYVSRSVDELVTGHGDFHWGNFRLPVQCIVDWEYWGKVPKGYDAAQLTIMSLAVPRISAMVDAHFGDLLDTDDGRRCLTLWCHVVLLSRKYEGAFAGLVDPVTRFMRERLDIEPSSRELGSPPWEE